MNIFDQAVTESGQAIKRLSPEILQINIGKLCNLTCVHCHVNAGPKRKEIITRETIDKILNWLEKTDIQTVDLTGGTPEMVPDFQYMIERIRGFKQWRDIITRLNATIINEPGYEWIPEFHKKHKIIVIASMPCYSADNVNEQRGDGAFDSSIKAFQQLNSLGYGKEADLKMHFVYNPNGAFLPPSQEALTIDYKREMQEHFGIVFNDLYCITNMPIARFASYLKNNGELEKYYDLLVQSFNPKTVSSLMCSNTINVSWLGEVFDCDFNQMLKLGLEEPNTKKEDKALYLWNIDLQEWMNIAIRTAKHCFGCTAGSGSSCGGEVI